MSAPAQEHHTNEGTLHEECETVGLGGNPWLPWQQLNYHSHIPSAAVAVSLKREIRASEWEATREPGRGAVLLTVRGDIAGPYIAGVEPAAVMQRGMKRGGAGPQ